MRSRPNGLVAPDRMNDQPTRPYPSQGPRREWLYAVRSGIAGLSASAVTVVACGAFVIGAGVFTGSGKPAALAKTPKHRVRAFQPLQHVRTSAARAAAGPRRTPAPEHAVEAPAGRPTRPLSSQPKRGSGQQTGTTAVVPPAPGRSPTPAPTPTVAEPAPRAPAPPLATALPATVPMLPAPSLPPITVPALPAPLPTPNVTSVLP
jgi:hypothetical protein